MNLQEASLPSSLLVSWLHFHPIVQLWTLLLHRRLVRLARLLCRPLFPFLGFLFSLPWLGEFCSASAVRLSAFVICLAGAHSTC